MKWIFPILFFFSLPVRAGHETHGGDAVVALFFGFAEKIQNCLPHVSEVKKNSEIGRAFNRTFAAVKVYSIEKTMLNGEEVDAINYPDVHEPKIYLSRSRWLVSSVPDALRSVLVLHEFLSLMGFDDSKYQYSNPWTLQMNNCLKGAP